MRKPSPQLDLFAQVPRSAEGDDPSALTPPGPPLSPGDDVPPAEPEAHRRPLLPVDLANYQGTSWPRGLDATLGPPPRVAVLRAVEAVAEVTGWSGAWRRVLGIWRASLDRLGPNHEANEATALQLLDGLPQPVLETLRAGMTALVRHFHVNGGYCDILGPAHMEVVSRGRQSATGQFFTPWDLCLLMARMTGVPETRFRPDGEPWSVNDPAVGAGATLLAFRGLFAERHGRLAASTLRLYAQDIDPDCVAMTAIQFRLTDWFAMDALLATSHLPPAGARAVVAIATRLCCPWPLAEAMYQLGAPAGVPPEELCKAFSGSAPSAGDLRAG